MFYAVSAIFQPYNFHWLPLDPRKQSGSCGRRTTNLALSSRGMKALRHVGLAEEIAPYQVPMFARMVHEVGGRTHALNYGRKEQVRVVGDSRFEILRRWGYKHSFYNSKVWNVIAVICDTCSIL